MPTKINKNLENSFVFAPNEMQQAAFEGAKQNECLEDGRSLSMNYECFLVMNYEWWVMSGHRDTGSSLPTAEIL